MFVAKIQIVRIVHCLIRCVADANKNMGKMVLSVPYVRTQTVDSVSRITVNVRNAKRVSDSTSTANASDVFLWDVRTVWRTLRFANNVGARECSWAMAGASAEEL